MNVEYWHTVTKTGEPRILERLDPKDGSNSTRRTPSTQAIGPPVQRRISSSMWSAERQVE
jgi:hypothetical protein